MGKVKHKYTDTYFKNVDRFYKQKSKMESLERAYNVHNQRYYGKAKRHNLLSNQYEVYKNIDPGRLSPSELNRVLKENARVIRELGFTSMSGDLAEASVLVELNNESYITTDWGDSEGEEYDREYLQNEQDRVFGEILANSLKGLRLTKSQLDRALSRSVLPDYVLEDVREELISYFKKLRK